MNNNEALLHAWIEMSMSIRGNRLVKELSFNEMVACHYIYYHQKTKGSLITATDLCKKTQLLKSQINQVLTSLEKKDIVRRIRSEEDKRKIYVELNEENANLFWQEHQAVMKIVDMVALHLGEEKTAEFTELMTQVNAMAQQF